MADKSKLRVVIDTNLIISASIVPKSPPDKLIKAWLDDSFTLVTSRQQLEEIKDVSKRKKLKNYPLFVKAAAELIENIEFVAEIINPLPLKDLPIHSRDPKDDFLLAAALAANADYLITGDEDLIVLNRNSALGKLKIISVSEFLNLL